MYQITRKTNLAKNLKRMQRYYPNDYDFIPRTWIIPTEMTELKQAALEKRKNKTKNKISILARENSNDDRITAADLVISDSVSK